MLDKHYPFVNEQIAFHERRVSEFKGNPLRVSKHKDTIESLKSLLNDMRAAQEKLNQPLVTEHGLDAANSRPKLSLSPAELEGLPPELMEELNITTADRAEFAVLNLLEGKGGVMSLDQILVGLYHATGEINKRQTLTSRLYRMVQKELIHSVPNKKGVYSLQKMTEEEADKL